MPALAFKFCFRDIWLPDCQCWTWAGSPRSVAMGSLSSSLSAVSSLVFCLWSSTCCVIYQYISVWMPLWHFCAFKKIIEQSLDSFDFFCCQRYHVGAAAFWLVSLDSSVMTSWQRKKFDAKWDRSCWENKCFSGRSVIPLPLLLYLPQPC